MHNPKYSHGPSPHANGSYHAAGQHTDCALIQRVLNGDTRAYREFEERYRNLIHSILRRCHICDQDHDDIYQELFVRLWAQDMHRLRLWQATGMNRFSYYLTAVVRNLICDWYRNRTATSLPIDSGSPISDLICMAALDTAYPAGEMSVDFDDHLLREERAGAVREAMSSLRARDADLIRRRYYAEQSYQEIGQALGMSVNNVGVALSNARMRLGRCLCRLQPDLFIADQSIQMPRQKRSQVV